MELGAGTDQEDLAEFRFYSKDESFKQGSDVI